MISRFTFPHNLKTKLLPIIFFSLAQTCIYAQGGTATPTPASVCSGQHSVIKLTGQVGTNIKWQKDSAGTFVFIYPLRTSDTLLTPPLTAVSRYRAVISTLNVVLPDTSTIATVSITPFSVGGTINLSSTNICENQTVIVSLNNDYVGNGIQWQLDTAGSFVDIPGAQSSSYSSPPLTRTTAFRAKITNASCPS